MEFLKNISQFSVYRPTGGDLLKLFRLAIEQDVSVEEAAAQFKSKSYFQNLNKKLKDKLLDGILLNSFSELTKVQQKHFTIRKRNLEVMMLLQSGQKATAIKIAEETLSNAIRYGLVDVALNMSKELEYYYSLSNPNTTKRNKYSALNETYKRYFDEEWEAYRLYGELAYCIQKKQSIEHILEKIQKLNLLIETNSQYKFRLAFYTTLVLYAQATNDRSIVIKTCNEAISFFKGSNIALPYTTKWYFSFYLIPIYLTEKNYAKAAVTIKKTLQLPSIGSYNWHLTLQYKALSGFYSSKPKITVEAWREAHSKRQKFQSKIVEDRWKLIEAYLAFYKIIGKIHTTKSFRLYRFLNEVTTIPNTQLLILELLHLLANNKRKKYMKKVETIPHYLQQSSTSRTGLFLKMLAAVEKGDYHPVRVAAHAKKHYQALLRTPVESVNINLLNTEPVPYETLWQFVLELLGR